MSNLKPVQFHEPAPYTQFASAIMLVMQGQNESCVSWQGCQKDASSNCILRRDRMGTSAMGKAFSAGVIWAQQLHKERIPQNVPGIILFFPSMAGEVEWTV